MLSCIQMENIVRGRFISVIYNAAGRREWLLSMAVCALDEDFCVRVIRQYEVESGKIS